MSSSWAMPAIDFAIRHASAADVGSIARHRAEMFRDIHGLDDAGSAVLLDASLVNLAVAVGSSRAAARLRALGVWLQRVTGGIFIGLGLKLALASRH